MHHVDRIVTGSRIVLESAVTPCMLLINRGKITGIVDPAHQGAYSADAVTDAGDCVVMPGAVDEHAHIWEPGANSHREDWLSGSSCAASGGITTLVEMAQAEPPVTTVAALENKKTVAAAKSLVDFTLWGGCTGGAESAIPQLAAAGCRSFKVFTASFGPAYQSLSDFELFSAMEQVAQVDGVLGVHCENSTLTDGFEARLRAQGRTGGADFEPSRPVISECDAIARVLMYAKTTGCRVLVLHLSTPLALPLIEAARREGVRVFVESCAHYLTMTTEQLERHSVFAKCAPPLRDENSRQGLWRMLKSGVIDCIASDHFPFFDEERLAQAHDIFAAPAGMAAFDAMLPRMIDEGVHRQGLSWVTLARLLSTNPARLHGLYPRKGAIRLGADADLVIVDPDRQWVYSGAESLSKVQSRRSPLEGRTLRGKVLETIVRGHSVFKDGQILQQPGYGRYIRPEESTAE